MSKRGAVTSCKGNSSFCGFLVISVPALPISNIIPPRHFNLQAMVPRALPPSGSSGGAAVLKEAVLTVISSTFTFTKMVQPPLPSAVPSWSQSDSLLRVGPGAGPDSSLCFSVTNTVIHCLCSLGVGFSLLFHPPATL